MRIKSDVPPIRENQLGDVNVFIHAFQRTLDAVEFFVSCLFVFNDKRRLRLPALSAIEHGERDTKKDQEAHQNWQI